jgi:hypothetical protein
VGAHKESHSASINLSFFRDRHGGDIKISHGCLPGVQRFMKMGENAAGIPLRADLGHGFRRPGLMGVKVYQD